MRLEDPAGWSGGDRLSRALRRSIMGAGVFHGRVRDGNGCGNPAMATGPPGQVLTMDVVMGCVLACVLAGGRGLVLRAAGLCGPVARCWLWSVYRVIRTARLSALLRLHLRPIDVVVFHGP